MFSAYRFESKDRAKIVRLGPWSYLWAGLFGGAYLVLKVGARGVLRGALLLFLFTVALVCLIFGTARFVPQSMQVIVLLLGILAILLIQSLKTAQLVRRTYYLRGWKIRQED